MKQKHPKRAYIIMWALLLSAAAGAQERVMTLGQCLDEAAKSNLALRRSRLAVDKAEAMQSTSFSLEPTGIALSQDPTGGGSPDNALTFSQTFELPMVYTARHSQLKAATDVERRRLGMTAAEVRRNVTEAYFELVYEREKLAILTRQDSLYADFRRVAEAKCKAGEAGNLELINARRLASENTILLQRAGRDYSSAQQRLMGWLSTDTLITPADKSLEAMEADIAPALDIASTPTAALGGSIVEASEASLKTVRRETLPKVSLAASTQLVIRGFNPYNVDRSAFSKGNFMGFEIGLSIPLDFGAQKGRIRAARREVEIARNESQERLSNLRKAYNIRLNDYTKAKTSLGYYRREAAEQADELARISRTSYENGSIGYVELMQNMQTAMEMRLNRAAAINEYNRAVIELNYLQGK